MTFDEHIKTIKYVFPKTIPIMAGFTFIGLAYGIYMESLGFGPGSGCIGTQLNCFW